MVAAAVGLSIVNINIKYIITFNGTVFGFIYCYLLPCLFHIKCAYFSKPRRQGPIELREENSNTAVDLHKEEGELHTGEDTSADGIEEGDSEYGEALHRLS